MQMSRVSMAAAAVAVFMVGQVVTTTDAFAQTQPVTVVIVRHPEAANEAPTFPLTPVGHQRAELLVQTFRDIRFTHIFASHTTRARQTVEPVAAVQNLHIVRTACGSKTIRRCVRVACAKRSNASVDGRTLPPSMRAI